MVAGIEWELRASNGTGIKLTDVTFQQETVYLPDCDNPYALAQLKHGPVRISAVIAGTGEKGIKE